MTEHEAISVFYQFAEMSNNQLLGYISLLSAFLVMSYFAATKISTVLMTIVLTLFSFVCFLPITQMNLVRWTRHLLRLRGGRYFWRRLRNAV